MFNFEPSLHVAKLVCTLNGHFRGIFVFFYFRFTLKKPQKQGNIFIIVLCTKDMFSGPPKSQNFAEF